MNERLIGRVTSVEGFRVVIRLDDGLKGHHKSGYEDIYEVGKVNSYIILPVGPDRVVAVVTAVKTVDETQLAKDRTAIYLTEAVRYLTATMVGTISNGKYKLGVTVYPTIDGRVWYVTKAELSYIFDEKDEGPIDFSNDYYLPIGESPSFPDFKVKINPDKFFGKHAAILGNTGSGKSCTVASILQSLFEQDYNGENLKHAHIIIFDTNGEYRQAFFGDKAKGVDPPKTLEVINPFYIDKDGLKVPYWFMNYDDFDYLFEPSGGAQAPVLKRAIGMAKSDYSSFLAPGLNEYTQKAIIELLNKYPEEIKKRRT
jgi:DNA helicase HerA-like ATPase